MSSGYTVENLIDTLWLGRLVEPAVLEELARGGGTRADSPRALALALVGQGVLTPYQADQCLAGKGAGLRLGAFRFLDFLGEGDLGRVFRASHEPTGREVAVKVLHAGVLPDMEQVHRFHREAEAFTRLAHPGLVAVFDDGAQDGTHYLVMEYVEGVGLSRFLEQSGPLSVARACEFARQAALALQYAYERRLVPCDVRPSDLIVADGGTSIKLLAAGQGRLGPSARGLGEFEFGRLLEPGADVADEDPTETRADILLDEARSALQGLGRVLLAMLGGGEGSALDLPAADGSGTPSDWPAGLAPVLRKMIAKDAGTPFESPGACAAALAPFCLVTEGTVPKATEALPGPSLPPSEAAAPIEEAPPPGRPALPPSRPRRRVLALVVLFLIGVAAGSVATRLALEPRPSSTTSPAPVLASRSVVPALVEPRTRPEPEPATAPRPVVSIPEPATSPDPKPTPQLTPALEPLPDPEPIPEPAPAATPKPASKPAFAPILVGLGASAAPAPVAPATPKEVARPAETAGAGDLEEYRRLIVEGGRALKVGQDDEAIRRFGQAIGRRPDLAPAYTLRALAFARKDSSREVILDCTRAIERNPRDALAYRLRGTALTSLGDHGGAIADATRALELHPDDAPSYNTRGSARFSRGESRQAIEDLTTAVRLDSSYASALGNLSWALSTANEPNLRDADLAVHLATRACDLTGWSDPVLLKDLAAAFAEARQFDRAILFQELALEHAARLPDRLVEQYRKRLKTYKAGASGHADRGSKAKDKNKSKDKTARRGPMASAPPHPALHAFRSIDVAPAPPPPPQPRIPGDPPASAPVSKLNQKLR